MSDPITIGGEPLAAGLTWFLDTFLTPAVEAAKARRRQKRPSSTGAPQRKRTALA